MLKIKILLELFQKLLPIITGLFLYGKGRADERNKNTMFSQAQYIKTRKTIDEKKSELNKKVFTNDSDRRADASRRLRRHFSRNDR